MVYQPAAGARDLLPLDVAQKRWIEDRLQQVFHRWGYHRIITSTLERMDTLMAGEAIQRQMVIQLQNGQDEELGLRPELTASIARTVVTRMADATYPQRLYYNANVFRRNWEKRHNRQQEYYQAGVELLGSGGLLANAEVLLLIGNCLEALDLRGWHLILGEAGITKSLLDAFPTHLRNKVRSAIAHLDRVTLDTLPLGDELHERAKIMLDLRGNSADVLQKVSSLHLDADQQEAVNNLKSLVELLESEGKFPLILDLSLIQTIDYYTGIVFEVVSDTDGQAQVLGRGGRYDQLLGLYHPQGDNIPGIGFELNIDVLYQVLSSTQQLPQSTPASNWLVVPESKSADAAAFAYAQKLRESSDLVRVEMDLGGRDAEAIREYAKERAIAQIAWIQADGSPKIEAVS
ncbi:ATP phosphoribosyltransferase regulatory subunit [Anabaena cylindrica FACHB-243]|uniref:ATP phosphoribosyltransferase regulatory subunit n=1 Tax=Anabaena cylindrica (strain ATCC 27899 / PCC 7122) TaxID=272123 RepID=K9Z9U4_ANACC|nr:MULTISPECIES: ATP phosphoribosyltransferase regulatory subunit [Anabaena]AFZ55973.1 ATP phosphoribosyltransferase regulatory subunit [Anabaena cylindrica PCC 7122]MBD2421393.1 ATP phosphoribosyltransferase regulatory subunit [Anabaena cylindrica FACHB-243]MBY5284333.1 ATP phosphoribosyltransferase regulatory subunit [Anabaena sp. CCAP 1446/1C]MBY5306239.1 ATP phosphoribosyltransferase regulatory subunit [Anabaena sp. CCAP 1446/1C]MCM2406726.1 ATP phosphoribosyltransferase regulatory subunit